MRRSVLMGLGLAATLAGIAAAQQPDAPPPRNDSARVHRDRGPGGRFDGRGGPGRGLIFKDITLTDAQKTQLQGLRKAEHDKFDANRAQMKKDFDEARAARQRGDTAAAKAIMQRNRQTMEQARTQQFAAIRNVLTADQRAQFDKNLTEMKQMQAKRGERFGRRAGA